MDRPHDLACVLFAAGDVVLLEDELGKRGEEGAGEVEGGEAEGDGGVGQTCVFLGTNFLVLFIGAPFFQKGRNLVCITSF